jgi:hypothetical protein
MHVRCNTHPPTHLNATQVSSFGVGGHVKLPGASASAPNKYDFGTTTYEHIYNDLKVMVMIRGGTAAG